jgi:hypothetical protein
VARIRTIKPEFWSSLTVAQLSPHARLTFLGLLNYVDDYGRGRDECRLIKAAVWPLDDAVGSDEIQTWLAEIESQLLVLRYAVKGRHYLQVANWDEHQRVHHPTASPFPAPPLDIAVSMDSGISREDSRIPREDSRKIREDSRKIPVGKERKGMEGKGMEWKGISARARASETEPILGALADACKQDLTMLTSRLAREFADTAESLRSANEDLSERELAQTILEFGQWYYEIDFPGHRPTIARFRDKWGAFLQYRAEPHTGNVASQVGAQLPDTEEYRRYVADANRDIDAWLKDSG